MTLLSPPAGKETLNSAASGAQKMGAARAARRRLKAWSRMTSKQKLADMQKEDRRRKGATGTLIGNWNKTLGGKRAPEPAGGGK